MCKLMLLKDKVEKLRIDILNKFNLTFSSTGEEVMNAYGYDKDTLKKECFLMMFLFQDNSLDVCSTGEFISKVEGNYYIGPNYFKRENETYVFSVYRKYKTINIKEFVEYIISLGLDEVVEVTFVYYEIYLGHIFLNKDGIKDIIFDEIPTNITYEDSFYISPELYNLIWTHSLLSLSINVPLEETFKLLKLI